MPYVILDVPFLRSVNFLTNTCNFVILRLVYHNFRLPENETSCNLISKFYNIQSSLYIVPTIFILSIGLACSQTSNKGYILLWNVDMLDNIYIVKVIMTWSVNITNCPKRKLTNRDLEILTKAKRNEILVSWSKDRYDKRYTTQVNISGSNS